MKRISIVGGGVVGVATAYAGHWPQRQSWDDPKDCDERQNAFPPIQDDREGRTIEQYFEREDRSGYFQGELFLMGGGTLEHNAIIFNLLSDLKPALRGGPCKLYGQDLRLWVDTYQLFTYPDLHLTCVSPNLFPARKDTVTDANLIEGATPFSCSQPA